MLLFNPHPFIGQDYSPILAEEMGQKDMKGWPSGYGFDHWRIYTNSLWRWTNRTVRAIISACMSVNPLIKWTYKAICPSALITAHWDGAGISGQVCEQPLKLIASCDLCQRHVHSGSVLESIWYVIHTFKALAGLWPFYNLLVKSMPT